MPLPKFLSAFLVCCNILYVQCIAQTTAQEDARFEPFVKQALKYPGSLAALENSLSNYLRGPQDFVELRKTILSTLQNEPSSIELQEMLSWSYLQEKNFPAAFIQEQALDRRLNEDGARLIELGQVARNNQNWETAYKCYQSVFQKGTQNRFYEFAAKAMPDVRCQQIQVSTQAQANQLAQESLKGYRDFLNRFPASVYRPEVLLALGKLEGTYLHQPAEALKVLEQALSESSRNPALAANCKMEMGDISLAMGKIWDAALLYGQVASTFGEEPAGQEARFRSARIYYFTGDFSLARSQLDVLKTATSELIANDALKLSLLIQENGGNDSLAPALKMFARSQLWIFRHETRKAVAVMDSLQKNFPASQLASEIMYARAGIEQAAGNEAGACILYNRILATFRSSIRADDALISLARVVETHPTRRQEASNLYLRLLKEYPGSFYVPEARKKIRQLRGESNSENL